jgi:hypothetical protein
MTLSRTLFNDADNVFLPPLLVSVRNAKALLGVGHTKVWALIKNKRLDVVYLDGRTLITRASIERLVQQLNEEAPRHKATAWAQRCGKLASAANKGRPPRRAHKARKGAA